LGGINLKESYMKPHITPKKSFSSFELV
jgi:hypothetical protein